MRTAAPQVVVAWEPTAELEFPVPVEDGEATVILSTSGYSGPTTIVARECVSSGVCEGPQTSVQVDVANPPPTFRSEGTWVSEWHGGDIAYWANEEGAWAWYAGFFDGRYVPPSLDQPFVAVPASKLGDGEHTVQIARCTEPPDKTPIVEPPVCDLANASEVRKFVVRTALHPSITAVLPRTISPDDNGVRDSATVAGTADTHQMIGWELLRDGESVATGGGVERAPGPYSFTVDGLDASGKPLPSGTYELRVRAVSLPSPDPGVDDRPITGETSTSLVIDRTSPRVSDASARPSVFYPQRSGWRDRTRITGTLSEPASRMRVELWRDGRRRRTLGLGAEPAGRFTTTWAGRRSDGRLARPGRYRYRFVTRDRAGNDAVRRGGVVRLRWRH